MPFRFQGRDPLVGLDCLGLVVLAFDLRELDAPTYRVTDGDWHQVERGLAPWFGSTHRTTPTSNDLAVFRNPRCFHFGVISGSHLVHADIVASKVVVRKMPARLPSNCSLYTYRED
ncbi:hypothetical protein [Sphingomonas sp. LHG3443-2]|uniref:hypothetical protein n=1 Tax=Sphingomonas sp. LHG3443-2 TaxID=2804639 RepID=UPI003CF2D60A